LLIPLEQRQHPNATVEIWAMDEHRIDLKPIVRGVWAPVRERRGTSPMQSARRCSKSYLPVSPNQLPENVALPGGIRLVFQPTHSPELQPAEHLGAFADEPLANRCFDTVQSLDQAVGDRCIALTQELDIIGDSTLFHWCPCERTST